MNKPLKLRWVLAHVPYDLFLRSANIFAKKVYEKSNGQIEINVIGLNEYNEDRKSKGLEPVAHGGQIVDLIDNGEVEMSQMYNVELAKINGNMHALEMPFIFRDHDHATKVLDGDIGMGLLQDLSKQSNIRGLAFTYSGGFRMIAGNDPITSVSDFNGRRIRVSYNDPTAPFLRSEVAGDIFTSLGATPTPTKISEAANAIENDQVDIGESTWARYYRTDLNKVTKHVSNTKHSLFLTAIIINKDIWNSLDPEMQEFMQTVALESAKSERLESLADGDEAIAQCAKDGIVVHEWSDEELSKLKAATNEVYDLYADRLPQDLIKSIRSVD